MGSRQWYRYLNNDPFRKNYLFKNAAKLVRNQQIKESVNRKLNNNNKKKSEVGQRHDMVLR